MVWSKLFISFQTSKEPFPACRLEAYSSSVDVRTACSFIFVLMKIGVDFSRAWSTIWVCTSFPVTSGTRALYGKCNFRFGSRTGPCFRKMDDPKKKCIGVQVRETRPCCHTSNTWYVELYRYVVGIGERGEPEWMRQEGRNEKEEIVGRVQFNLGRSKEKFIGVLVGESHVTLMDTERSIGVRFDVVARLVDRWRWGRVRRETPLGRLAGLRQLTARGDHAHQDCADRRRRDTGARRRVFRVSPPAVTTSASTPVAAAVRPSPALAAPFTNSDRSVSLSLKFRPRNRSTQQRPTGWPAKRSGRWSRGVAIVHVSLSIDTVSFS